MIEELELTAPLTREQVIQIRENVFVRNEKIKEGDLARLYESFSTSKKIDERKRERMRRDFKRLMLMKEKGCFIDENGFLKEDRNFDEHHEERVFLTTIKRFLTREFVVKLAISTPAQEVIHVFSMS